MKYLNNVSYKDCVGKVCKSKSSGDYWFKEGDLTNAISPFTLIKIT